MPLRLGHLGALEAGFRGLMIDLYMYDGDFNSTTPKTLHACHGLCSFGSRDARDEFKVTADWLSDHPGEVVQLFLENPDGREMDDALYGVLRELGMTSMLVEKKADGSWPTMRECILENRRIVIFKMAGCDPEGVGMDDDGNVKNQMDSGRGCLKGFHNAFDNSYDTNFELADVDSVYTGEYTGKGEPVWDTGWINRGDNYEGKAAGNMLVMNHFLMKPIAALALDMNEEQFIKDRVEAMEDGLCDKVNWIACDFWSVGGHGAVKAAQWNNKRAGGGGSGC